MEKGYKGMCLLMSAIIILSSFTMLFSVGTEKSRSLDFFGCKDIVENIRNCELDMTSVIYAKNSQGEWEEYQRIHGDENRIWVDIEKIPQQLINAFIAIEDQRFYQHNGVDWKRTTGAFVNYLPFINIYSSNQGGSTITQQLIKNITTDNDTSAIRKLREITRALLIEKMLDKTTILEAYLNTISLGNGICGVQVAANYYFNKDVGDLTLNECASLAAITKNPSAYNPDTKPAGNKERRQDVLKKMYQLDMISEKELADNYIADIVLDKSQQQDLEIQINNYFIDALIEEVINDFSEKYGCSKDTASAMLYNGGYRIYATINPQVQEEMEKVYLNQKRYFPQLSTDRSAYLQSAMTIMDYSGNIVGLVGGVGEKTRNRGLNRATDSPRQPGSTMKPLGVYTLAIENGYANFSTLIEDKPIPNYYGNGKSGPAEWYGTYDGYMTVKTALERSANTIPCWLLRDKVGIENSFNFLTQKLKLSHLTDVDKNLSSLALGGCQYGITTTESAAAYAIYGNGGIYYEPTTYVKVIDSSDEIILESGGGERVIKSTTATIMNRLLQNVVYGAQGTGGGIAGYSSMRAYAKTGTSSESNDLWMVAGTPYYVGAVWCGFDQPQTVYNQSAAATVWRAIMAQVHKGLEYKNFTYDDTVVPRTCCAATGNSPLESCVERFTGYFSPEYAGIGMCSGVHPVVNNTEETESTPSETSSAESSSHDSTSSSDVSSQAPPTSSDDTVTSDETLSSDETVSNESGESSESDVSDGQGESSGSGNSSENDESDVDNSSADGGENSDAPLPVGNSGT